MPNSYGNLRVRAYTAGGALPVANAIVRVKGGEERNRYVAYSLITDRDGITTILPLPAPEMGYSLTPYPSGEPFYIYDVEITADGYFPEIIRGVQIFSGVNSVQPIALIPLSQSAPINHSSTDT